MINNNYLDFLRDRINEIRSGIFFNLSNSAFKLPTSIVSVLKTDEEGQIWFFLPVPDLHLEEEDFVFPARLDFYRKGKSFYLSVNGTASVMPDIENTGLAHELPGFENEVAFNRMMLIKLKVVYVEYNEKVSRAQNWLENMMIQIFDRCHHILNAMVRRGKEICYGNSKNAAWKF